MCNRYLSMLILFGVSSYLLLIYSCRTKNHSEEQVIQWLLKCPPVSNPARWPPEAYTYDSHEEWAAAGRKIKGIEEILTRFYENNTTGRPMWMIILALGLVNPDNSGPILIQALKDESQPITARVTAANLLGDARNHAAVDPLCYIVHLTDSEHLKYNAISALGIIGDPNARPVVERELEDVRIKRDFLIKVLEEIKEK
ncbi:MAG: hypothetical protein AMJ75_03435 [Phycisphaerae bacterium SM1_79]|nr:MAG: hypothetical protein AMJ75_03435 [Phycisphaerae bacterium SM1_79]